MQGVSHSRARRPAPRLALAALFACLASGLAPTDARVARARWPKPWVGMHVCIVRQEDYEPLKRLIAEALAPLGVNALVLDLSYNGYRFESHPRLKELPRWQKGLGLTRAQARELGSLCRWKGIRIIPYYNCLGHQSWGPPPDANSPLLSAFPEFDETPGRYPDNKGIYARSWCPSHPDLNPVVFSMFDEMIDAFRADAAMIGTDEVVFLADPNCPRCLGKSKADLFVKQVTDLYRHLAGRRKVEVFLWHDTLSALGVAARLPKDLVVCYWDYGRKAAYPELQALLKAGFRVWPAGWNDASATRALMEYAQQVYTPRMVGHLYTGWDDGQRGSMDAFRRVILREGDVSALARTNSCAFGVGTAIRETIGLTRPRPRVTIELAPTAGVRGYRAGQRVQVRVSLSKKGLYGQSYRAARAQVLLVEDEGRASRALGEVGSGDRVPRWLEFVAQEGICWLSVEGTATNRRGRRTRFTARSPEIRMVGAEWDARLMPAIEHPPDVGQVLAVATPPELRRSARSDIAGWVIEDIPSDSREPRAVLLAFREYTGSTPGQTCSVSCAFAVPAAPGRVGVQFYLFDREVYTPNLGYRVYQLLARPLGSRDSPVVLWEEDIVVDREGRPWTTVEVPEAARSAAGVELTLQILDRKGVGNFATTSVVGPIRLVRLP